MDFALVVPDVHIPFEDKRAFELMLQICRSEKVNIKIVCLLGDFIDMYGLSMFEKCPSFGDIGELYEREIECGNKRLDQLDELGAGEYVYIEGNHEFRVKKYLKKFAPAIRNRLGIPQELKLDQRPYWKWVPFDRFQSYEIPGTNIFLRHCPPVGGGIENVAKQSGASIIFGHDHTVRETTFVSKISGQQIIAAGSGWLGDASQKVFDYVPGHTNWSLAFRLVDQYAGIHLIRIHKDNDRYYAVFGDKEFVG